MSSPSLLDHFIQLSDADLDERVWKICTCVMKGEKKKFYVNLLTRQSIWHLPPNFYGRIDDDELAKAKEQAKARGFTESIDDFASPPPTRGEDEPQEEITEVFPTYDDLDIDDADDVEEEIKAVDHEFVEGDPRCKKKDGLVDLCDHYGIVIRDAGGKTMKLKEIWDEVRKFWSLMHDHD